MEGFEKQIDRYMELTHYQVTFSNNNQIFFKFNS